jgi:hypothetical protein
VLPDDAAAGAACALRPAAEAEGEGVADAVALRVRGRRRDVRAPGAALERQPDELALGEREALRAGV